MSDRKAIRCAVCTRKSSEEDLEQSFNSLDAQREACRAYIESQRHEGWRPVSTHYDDGGYSGGSLERPALKHLLDDISAGKVDAVVVYKVDRLTRSLRSHRPALAGAAREPGISVLPKPRTR
jgi:DNA invertase Pin-like site-specific DNA recombinase